MDYRRLADRYADVMAVDAPKTPAAYPLPSFDTADDSCVESFGEGEWRTTDTDAAYPVLRTGGIANCIGIGLYDEAARYGMLSHTSSNDVETVERNEHLQDFYADVSGTDHTFDVTWAVGNNPDLQVLKTGREVLHDTFPADMIGSERLRYIGAAGSLVLDTRTGQYLNHPGDFPEPGHLLTGGDWRDN